MQDTAIKSESQALFHDLDKPSLHALSYSLRHPDTWPQGFVWDFNKCDQCAMGLAHQLWKGTVPAVGRASGPSVMAHEFAMPFGAAKSIFLGNMDWLPKDSISEGRFWSRKTYSRANHDRVTPEMVADQIDAYLATAE